MYKEDNDTAFRVFKKKLYHASIAAILEPLRAAMTVPVVRQCPDRHYRRVIFDLAAFIADYPEQVMLSGIVQGWCAKYFEPLRTMYKAKLIFVLDVLLVLRILMDQEEDGHVHCIITLQHNCF